MSLLDEAKKVPVTVRGRKPKFKDEDVDELVRAFMRGEIKYTQMAAVVSENKKKNYSNAVYSKGFRSMLRMFRSGELVFKK